MGSQTAEERIQQQRRQWVAKRKAADTAKQRLASEGISYPILISGETPGEYYDRVQEYAAKEAAYILEALRQPDGPRPIIEFKKEEYKPYKDD